MDQLRFRNICPIGSQLLGAYSCANVKICMYLHDPFVTATYENEMLEEDEVPPTVAETRRNEGSDNEELTPNFDLITPESHSTPAAAMVVVDDSPLEQEERQGGEQDTNESTCKIFIAFFKISISAP